MSRRRQVPPGHYLLAKPDGLTVQRYWEVQFPLEGDGASAGEERSLEDCLEEFRALLGR